MMLASWGLPGGAKEKAEAAYGDAVGRAVTQARTRLADDAWRATCLSSLGMSQRDGQRAIEALSALG